MDNVISTILNYLETILYFVNPVTVSEFTMHEVSAFGRAIFALLVGGLVYSLLKRSIHMTGWPPGVISFSFSILSTMFLPDEFVALMLVLYCAFTRIIDGLGSGLFFGSLFRRPFAPMFLLATSADQNGFPFHEIYSLAAAIFGFIGIYRLVRRIPAFSTMTAVPVALGLFSVLGASMLPLLGKWVILMLLIFPVFSILGFISGWRGTMATI